MKVGFLQPPMSLLIVQDSGGWFVRACGDRWSIIRLLARRGGSTFINMWQIGASIAFNPFCRFLVKGTDGNCNLMTTIHKRWDGDGLFTSYSGLEDGASVVLNVGREVSFNL